jgi:ankyrin repeat/BTB/POZ domain-containing protein 1
MLLLPDLKRQCGIFLASFLETGNVADLLRTARLYDIPRLEHQCVEFIAENIEEVTVSF